ncbi:MAG: 2-oxo acid dehydrogenase subunit E2 [Candidatus Schekmanbacteria bacterium]|nr:2-oxo acid dehydrogenase subunit E2 [Candidatus Schekmanbacteria bacterium]
MLFEFRFPDVGEGIHEAQVVEWLVRVGQHVQLDAPFVKVETDKAVVELPAPRSGVVAELRADAGSTIHVGEVIAVFSLEAPAGTSAEETAAVEPAARVAALGAAAGVAVAAPVATLAAAAPEPAETTLRPPATPHTRLLARSLGVDLAAVRATGRAGRITDEDVERAHAARPETRATVPAIAAATPAVAAPATAEAAAPVEPGVSLPLPEVAAGAAEEERVPLTHLRKVIAEAMALSKHTSAHVTHVDEADVTELLALYHRMKPLVAEADGVDLSLTPLFVKAVVAALKRHPLLNASLDPSRGEIVYKKLYHIGVAVDTAEGLVVPVLRDADKKSIVQLAAELADKAARARARRLALDDLRGASFTISNLGPIGGLFATPIIHQPELAIVGLHAIKDRPAVVAGAVVPRKLMMLSVSFDHRIIDGAVAARFMVDLVRNVENPDLLMVRL